MQPQTPAPCTHRSLDVEANRWRLERSNYKFPILFQLQLNASHETEPLIDYACPFDAIAASGSIQSYGN
jgi:hypothetical protein